MLFCSCRSSGVINSSVARNSEGYLIEKIKSVNNWYVIYASKGDSLFKIIVKNEKVTACRQKVAVGGYFSLSLHSVGRQLYSIDGKPVQMMSYLEIQCHVYDDKTEFCTEPKKGIYDLYNTNDIVGLCYVKEYP